GEVPELLARIGYLERRPIDVADVQGDVGQALVEYGIVAVDEIAQEPVVDLLVGALDAQLRSFVAYSELEVFLTYLQHVRGELAHLLLQLLAGTVNGGQAGDGKLARIGAGMPGERIPVGIE